MKVRKEMIDIIEMIELKEMREMIEMIGMKELKEIIVFIILEEMNLGRVKVDQEMIEVEGKDIIIIIRTKINFKINPYIFHFYIN